MLFLVQVYYTHPGFRTSIFGKNRAYCIRDFTVAMTLSNSLFDKKSYFKYSLQITAGTVLADSLILSNSVPMYVTCAIDGFAPSTDSAAPSTDPSIAHDICMSVRKFLRLLTAAVAGRPAAACHSIRYLRTVYGQTVGVHNIFHSALCRCH